MQNVCTISWGTLGHLRTSTDRNRAYKPSEKLPSFGVIGAQLVASIKQTAHPENIVPRGLRGRVGCQLGPHYFPHPPSPEGQNVQRMRLMKHRLEVYPVSIRDAAHAKIFPKSCQIKPKSDCIYHAPINFWNSKRTMSACCPKSIGEW